jgi:serine protease inhibitor
VTGPVPALTELPRPLTALEQAVVESSNGFAFELLGAVDASSEGENVFLSPLSVSMALGMTMNGAEGPTYDQMRSTLGFGGLERDEVNAAYRGLLDLLLDLDPSVEIAIANSIWYRAGFPFEEDFFDLAEASFDATVEGLPFDDAALGRINGWVGEATRGRIDSILDRISADDVMFLINAIYFKGDWRDQFDPASTRSDTFTLPGGGDRSVQMMNRSGDIDYAGGDGFEAVDLPYGNGAFTMTILLPNEGREVESLVQSLDEDAMARLHESLRPRDLMLSVPKFEIEFEAGLIDPLQSLGMVHVFDPAAADLSRMARDGGLYVSEVRHKSFVKVDEVGTEAAAVTSVTVTETSAPPSFRVDRPFAFFIRERFSGTILFAGKIADPSPG